MGISCGSLCLVWVLGWLQLNLTHYVSFTIHSLSHFENNIVHKQSYILASRDFTRYTFSSFQCKENRSKGSEEQCLSGFGTTNPSLQGTGKADDKLRITSVPDASPSHPEN